MVDSSSPSDWTVHKFGGTSVADAARYRAAADIVLGDGEQQVVVVSAMAGITDGLIDLTQRARTRDGGYRIRLEDLCKRVIDVVEELFEGEVRDDLSAIVVADEQDLSDVLRAIWLGRSCPDATLELVSGYGELWSAQILARLLAARGADADWVDARRVLTVEHGDAGPLIDWAASRQRLQAFCEERPAQYYVVTGFVASTPEGVPTTLKRNGSDFSASIFGSLFDAQRITIWTDVDGVLSADPRRVPEAVVLDEMSYSEAMELAYFGASVLHPNTMAPAVDRGTPVWIRNARRPELPGTRIGAPREPEAASKTRVVQGLSTVDGITLVNVEGTGMIGVPGVARRLFGALERVDVSVTLISQASSEHSICFAVPGEQAERAVETVKREFFAEMHHGQIQTVETVSGCSILAAVGDRMAHTPGVSAHFFGALASAGVNVRAIAQGSSERNISVVINEAQSTRALRAVHSGFYLSKQTLSVGLVGPGLIGATLLDQIAGQTEQLRERLQVELRVRGIANSTRMLLDPVAIDLADWADRFEVDAEPLDWERFAAHVHAEHLPHAVMIDCTASDLVSDHYPNWLARGLHVVTPNKKAGSGDLARYLAIRAACQSGNTRFLYEATVGAGLPVISTVQDLVGTGDRVQVIEGVFSGTLAFLFGAYDGTEPFSTIVAGAKELGYTEPDPRDDLSGMDVARKLVILAREVGIELELSEVEVESLVPAELQDPSIGVADFMERYPMVDERMRARLRDAQLVDGVLRYVGVVDADGRASVQLRAVSMEHAFARIQGSDNIMAFRTERYFDQPLIVQGPGAGPAVTAGGVFADLLRLAATAGGGR